MNELYHKIAVYVTNDYLVKLKTELTPLIWGDVNKVIVHRTFYVPATLATEESLISTTLIVTRNKYNPIREQTYKAVLQVHNPKLCYEADIQCSYLKDFESFLLKSITATVDSTSYTKNTA